MKIVAGKYGGRRLLTPKNRDIRPTSDKVRGAIFNMLASRGALEGAVVLDAFCGTGALGLEALSRGAEHCMFIDKSRTSLALTRENANVFGVGAEASYVSCDVLRWAEKHAVLQKRVGAGHAGQDITMPKPEPKKSRTESCRGTHCSYGLVFLDPPYRKGLISEIVPYLMEADMLYDGAWIIAESERGFFMPVSENIRIDSEKIYGDTKVELLQYFAKL